MKDSDKYFTIGIGYSVTKVESFTIKNLIFLFKLLKRISIVLFYKLKEVFEFIFNKENRKTTVMTILISTLLVKIFQIVKNIVKAFKEKKLENAVTNKENKVLIEKPEDNNENEKGLNKNDDSSNILMSYALDIDNKGNKLVKETIHKIKTAVEIQRKLRDKLNLPKESLNTPFYNILKLYISDNLNKN